MHDVKRRSMYVQVRGRARVCWWVYVYVACAPTRARVCLHYMFFANELFIDVENVYNK